MPTRGRCRAAPTSTGALQKKPWNRILSVSAEPPIIVAAERREEEERRGVEAALPPLLRSWALRKFFVGLSVIGSSVTRAPTPHAAPPPGSPLYNRRAEKSHPQRRRFQRVGPSVASGWRWDFLE